MFDGFEKVTGADVLETDELPRIIRLPPEVVAGLQLAWERSFAAGKSQEQGGILVRHPDGRYEWKSGVAGDSGSFEPNYADAGAGQTVVALAHTHPYDVDEGGHSGVPFSGQDLARQVHSDDRFKLVRSGDHLFATVRSKEFQRRLAVLDDDGKKKLSERIRRDWTELYHGATGSVMERAQAATRATTEKYRMPYYEGTGDQLHVVEWKSP